MVLGPLQLGPSGLTVQVHASCENLVRCLWSGCVHRGVYGVLMHDWDMMARGELPGWKG